MYYFLLDESNVDFAASINDDVRPQIRDNSGNTQMFIVYTDGRPNDIASAEDETFLHVAKNGTQIIFKKLG